MTMRFGHLELMTEDPAVTARFYVEALGFEVVAEQGPDFTWVGLRGLEILLRRGTPPRGTGEYRAGPAAIVLYTDDVDAAVARLAAAGVDTHGDDGPGNPLLRDPDGRWIQLANPG